VLVHGALGDFRQWAPIAEALAPRFRVTAISRRHHWPGEMPSIDTPYTYDGHSADLQALLREFGAPVHLVGHSYGAGVALLAAIREPALVRRLVLIEPAFGSLLESTSPELATEVATRSAMLESTQRLARAGDHTTAARELINWLQESDAGFDNLPEGARNGLLENAATVGPTFAVAAPTVTCADLEGFAAPALVLHGARSRLYFRRVAERAAACLLRGTLASIPGCGHMSIVENPGAVAAQLDGFLVQN
jgi:pimeloyl-ACP methyl ester carboxylesterase